MELLKWKGRGGALCLPVVNIVAASSAFGLLRKGGQGGNDLFYVLFVWGFI